MRTDLAHRLLASAELLADTKIDVDSFVSDTVEAHMGLLDATERIEELSALLERSGIKSPVERLNSVKDKIDAALEVLRKLDSLYHSGRVSFGKRAPQVSHRKNTHSLQRSQESPSKDRPSRSLLSRR